MCGVSDVSNNDASGTHRGSDQNIGIYHRFPLGMVETSCVVAWTVAIDNMVDILPGKLKLGPHSR